MPGGKNERPVVAVVRCRDYSPEETRRAVEEAVELLDLEKGFFDVEGEILLKPNLLSRRPPEQAVTTHPAVVEAVIALIRSRSPGARLAIGDSPGGALGRIESFWEKTGFTALSERTGVPLVSFEDTGSKAFTPPPGFPGLASFSLASRALDAAMIVNLPKMKTHSFTYMTCAMKNLYGLVPGLQKAAIHKALPDHRTFCRFIAHLNTLVKPALHVVDAVVAMEGNGPSSGTPRRVGLILAGTHAAAVDVAAAVLMGIPPRAVSYIREAGKHGSPVSVQDILARGVDLREAAPTRFKLPATYRINKWLSGVFIRLLGPLLWSRPAVDASLCTQCGKCVDSCPVQAMSLAGKNRGVEIDYGTCINCLCCHELCDRDAVTIRFSFLARKLFRTDAYEKVKRNGSMQNAN